MCLLLKTLICKKTKYDTAITWITKIWLDLIASNASVSDSNQIHHFQGLSRYITHTWHPCHMVNTYKEKTKAKTYFFIFDNFKWLQISSTQFPSHNSDLRISNANTVWTWKLSRALKFAFHFECYFVILLGVCAEIRLH